jgi:hypothetical protein
MKFCPVVPEICRGQVAEIAINGRPRRVKFQLGDQIFLCGRPVGECNLFITSRRFPLPTELIETALKSVSVLIKCQTETKNLFIYSVRPRDVAEA